MRRSLKLALLLFVAATSASAADIALHSAYELSDAAGVFHESISTVVVSFLLHW